MQNQEILAIIILAILLALLLIAFISVILFLYKKRQNQHEVEVAKMQEEYDQQILRVQFEMQEATLAEISNKLHDSVKNNINGIAMSIAAMQLRIGNKLMDSNEILEELKNYEDKLITVRDEIRLTSHSLSHDKLEKVGLVETIEFEANRTARNNKNLHINTTINKKVVYNFTQEQSVYLFRIFQEIIGNVLTHSKATELAISINLTDKNIFNLSIEDNGIGFNVADKQKSKLSGIGLSGMKKRAVQIGANLQIESILQKGTTIKIELPLPLQQNPEVNVSQKTKYSFD